MLFFNLFILSVCKENRKGGMWEVMNLAQTEDVLKKICGN